MTERVSRLDGARQTIIHTNFLRLVGIASKHDARTVAAHTRSTEICARQGLAELHCLLGQVLTHAVRDGIAVFASLDALLGEKLDLGTSVMKSVSGEVEAVPA